MGLWKLDFHLHNEFVSFMLILTLVTISRVVDLT